MYVSTKKDLIDLIAKNSFAIKSFGVKRIGLFGSFVRNEHQEKSDVDLLVEFDPEKKNFDNFMGLANFL